jgi:hypothetical protein
MVNKFLRLLGVTLVVALVIGLVITAIGLLLRWDSPVKFSNIFFWVGAGLIILGIVSILGGYKMRSDFGVLYSQSSGDMNIIERSKRWAADISQAYDFNLILLLTGLFLIGFSILIPNVF